MKSLKSNVAAGYLMIIPAAVCLIGFLGYPIVKSLLLSFQNYSQAGYYKAQYVGIKNFVYLLSSAEFLASLRVTAIYTIVAVGVEMVVGFVVALAVFAETRGSRILRALYIVPMVVAPVAAGLLWRYMYQPTFGILDYVFLKIGLIQKPIIFLGLVGTALPSLLVVEIWKATPFVIVVYIAGLASLPQEPYDAAIVDGASGWQMIRFVTLPMLRSITLIILVIRSMDAFRSFDLIYVLTRGGPAGSTATATFFTWTRAFRYFDLGNASAGAYIITLVILLMSLALIVGIRGNKE
jgi:multiple sugar transport system permease protein